MNGPTGAGISGGDMHATRLARAWQDRSPGGIVVVAPTGAMDALAVDDAMRRPLDTWLDRYAPTCIGAYVIVLVTRMWRSAWLRPPVGVAVASSHLFHDVVPCIALKLRGSRIVAYVYHLIRRERSRPSGRDRVAILLERLSLALLARHHALVFVDDSELVRPLVQAGIRRENVVLTANAYDPLQEMPPRQQQARPTVVFCGRLVPQKGVWDLFEIARRFAIAGRDVDVVVLGDGPEGPAMKQRARAQQLDRLHVMGFVTEEEKWVWLRSADVFVSPSTEEGWGIAVGEAVLAGVPAVAYDLPAYRHLGLAVITVPLGSVDDMAREVERLLDDEEYRASRLGELSRQRLPTWTEILSAELDAVESRCG